MTAKKNNVMAVSCLLTGALVWGLIWFPYRALQEAGVGGALGSLLTYFFALVNVLSRKATQVDEAVKAGAVWAGVVLVALPAAILTERPVQALAAMDARTWLLVGRIAMTLFCINLVVQFGLARTTANRAIVIMLAELVFAAASSYFLAYEQIGWRDWLGGAMLVAAALCSGRLEASAHG